MKSLAKAVALTMPLVLAAIVAAAFAPLQPARGATDPLQTCISHQKNLAIASLIYAGDYDDFLSRPKDWMDNIFPYMKNKSVLHCPSVPASSYGYAYNSAIAGKNTSKVANPAKAVMLFDSTLMGKSAVSSTRTMPKKGRHEGKNVRAFLDAHVKAMAP